jgi:hypothetical protein
MRLMKRKTLTPIKIHKSFVITFVSILIIIQSVSPVLAQNDSDFIQLISPGQDKQVISKKPLVKVAIKGAFSPDYLLALLDGIDITAVLEITSEGFEYRPVEVLPAGTHNLTVVVYTEDWVEIQQEFIFSTRHTEKFEEAYTKNELTTIYENSIVKPNDVENVPNSKLESNLLSMITLSEGAWNFRLSTSLRYLDQSIPVSFPEKKGMDLINYLLEGRYSGEKIQVLTEIGDVQVNETQNTAWGLARRGGRLNIQYEDFDVGAFIVNSQQIYGFRNVREGIGIDSTKEDHIMGISAEAGFLEDKVSLKTVYITGGEEGSSFGIYTEGGGNKGDVLGVVLKTDFFNRKLTTEAEFDFSEFDPDISDEFTSENDKAYRLKAEGHKGKYTYGIVYDYMGPDYEVVGDFGLPKDREGVTVNGGANFKIHSVNLQLSRYNDNVKKNDLYPRTYTKQGMIDYSFNKFKHLPMGLSYQRSIVDSTMEPDFYDPLRIDTDVLSGRINYLKDSWNLGLQTYYSIQDDKEFMNNDTTIITYTFTSSYTLKHFSISPGFSFNRTKLKIEDLKTDTYTVNLDIRGDALHNKLDYGLAGTFNRTKSSDNFTELNTVNMDFEVAYHLGKKFLEFLNPTVGMRGQYWKADDSVSGIKNEEFTVMAIFSTSMPFSF